MKDETYLGDGLYAKYDGFAVYLRAPRAGGDHYVALEPQVMHNFIEFVMTITHHAKIVRNVVRQKVDADETRRSAGTRTAHAQDREQS